MKVKIVDYVMYNFYLGHILINSLFVIYSRLLLIIKFCIQYLFIVGFLSSLSLFCVQY